MSADCCVPVRAGECLLEWDGGEGERAPAPLLKDMFGSERRKAKVRARAGPAAAACGTLPCAAGS